MAQFARPNFDESSGNWTYSTGSSLFETINEATPVDSDFNFSGVNPANDMFEVNLTSVNDPNVHTGHTFRYRYQLLEGGGGSGTVTMITCALYQGTTPIASSTQQTVKNTTITTPLTLLETEADDITDYGDLRLRITANKISGGKDCEVYVYWAELEVPDVSGQALTEIVPEVEQIVETTQARLALRRAKAETENLVETIKRKLDAIRKLPEEEQLVESVNYIKAMARSFDEEETIVETVSALLGLARTVDEVEYIGESVLLVLGKGSVTSDVEQLVETVQARLALMRKKDETETLVENVKTAMELARKADDEEQITESLNYILGILRSVDEEERIVETAFGVVTPAGLSLKEYAVEVEYIGEVVVLVLSKGSVTSEVEQLVENVKTALAFRRVIAETETISESAIAKLAAKRTINEVVQLAETTKTVMAQLRIAPDEEQIVETTLAFKTMARIVLETETLVETVRTPMFMRRFAAESAEITETIRTALTLRRPVDEVEQIVETVAKIIGRIRKRDEVEQIVEAAFGVVTPADGLTATVAEVEQLVEVVRSVLNLVRAPYEEEQIAETVIAALSAVRHVPEIEQLVETVNSVLALTRKTTEEEQIAEAVKYVLGKSVTTAETETIVEGVLTFLGLSVKADEVVQLAEAVYTLLGRTRSADEEERVIESVLTTLAYVRKAPETEAIVESVVTAGTFRRIVTETEQIAETAFGIVSAIGGALLEHVVEEEQIEEAVATIKRWSQLSAPYGNLILNESFEYYVKPDGQNQARLWEQVGNEYEYSVHLPQRIPGAGRLGGAAMEIKSSWVRWQTVTQSGVHLPLSVESLTRDNEFWFWFKPITLSNAGGSWPTLEISLTHTDSYVTDYDWINVTLTLDPAVYPIGVWHRYYTNNHRPPGPPGAPRFWLSPEWMYHFTLKMDQTGSASLGMIHVDDVLLGHETAWEGTLAITRSIRAAVVADLTVLANATVEELPKELSEAKSRTVFFMEGPGGDSKEETFTGNESRQAFRLGLFIRADTQVQALADLDDFQDEVRNIIERTDGTTALMTKVRKAGIVNWSEPMTPEDVAQGEAYRELEVEVFYHYTLGAA